MKLTLICALLLSIAVVATAAIGYAPSQARWGTDGVSSMTAVAVICLGSAMVALMPMAVIAPRKPAYIGQAALAATVIRLLLTMGTLVAYQVLFRPHMTSFLFWAPVFYLLLLAIETTFGVLFVKRYLGVTTAPPKGAAS